MNPLVATIQDIARVPGYDLLLLGVLGVVTFYAVITLMVGMARMRYGIPAPATSGHPDFERRLRVQVNTGEQLAPFFAALAVFALVMGPWLATIACLTWLLGRILYAIGYYRAPRLRYPGFALSMAVLSVMIAWALVAILRGIIDHSAVNSVPYCDTDGKCGIER